jgi:hypothetical protein
MNIKISYNYCTRYARLNAQGWRLTSCCTKFYDLCGRRCWAQSALKKILGQTFETWTLRNIPSKLTWAENDVRALLALSSYPPRLWSLCTWYRWLWKRSWESSSLLWRIGQELWFGTDRVGHTIFFIRKDSFPTALIPNVSGFRPSFPEAHTIWEPEVRDPASHVAWRSWCILETMCCIVSIERPARKQLYGHRVCCPSRRQRGWR